MAAERYRSLADDGGRSPRPSGGDDLVLDHVQVAAPPGCEPAARVFYGELLGLAELPKPPALSGRGGAWFALGGAAQLHVGVVQDGFVAAAKAHPALRARDAAALRGLAGRLGTARAPVQWADPDEIPGVQRFFTADPWGNRIELLAPAGD